MKSQAANDSPKKAVDDPFVVLDAESFSSNASSATFHDPLEDFGIPISSGGANDTKTSSTTAAGISEIFDGFAHSIPTVSTTGNSSTSENLPRGTNETSSPNHRGANETFQGKSATDFVSDSEKNTSVAYSGRGITEFDLSSSNDDVSNKSFSNKDARSFRSDFPSYDDDISQGVPQSTRSDRATESVTDRWITIDEVILFTQPTRAPPPRRPPPPLFVKHDSTRKTSHFNDKRENSFSSIYKLEEFAMGGSHVQSNGDQRENYSAAGDSTAAMMEAMEKAEAKLKQAKEAREREKEEREREARMYRAKEKEREEKALQEAKEREEKERAARLAHEARLREEREREEQERERQRIERERELERERERDRIAVERATKEARERAAADARERAQRAAVERATKEARERAAAEARERAATEARERAERERIERERVERAAAEARQRAAERAAVERAAGEARERAERAAVERAQAEARERAAAEAREKAERAVAEKAAVERAAAEVRMRAERVAVSRANAEARERAAAAAAAAKERQRTERRNDNDLESFFSNIGSRATSEPKQRPPTADSVFDDLFQNKTSSSTEGPRRAPPQAPASGMRKTASQTTMVDDFTSLFNAAPSSDVFQEVEGEAEERRRARWDRHQRTRERAAKALAEKNERDLQAQREQAERHRLAETVDAEIKRWAAGKEGNLRALLSTLQYILWPEAGWQPVSLTDVITAASVKKVYRKATLCVHPDKVQQKGATTQQKYIAEKVFDMLKEAWNKFNSEELF